MIRLFHATKSPSAHEREEVLFSARSPGAQTCSMYLPRAAQLSGIRALPISEMAAAKEAAIPYRWLSTKLSAAPVTPSDTAWSVPYWCQPGEGEQREGILAVVALLGPVPVAPYHGMERVGGGWVGSEGGEGCVAHWALVCTPPGDA